MQVPPHAGPRPWLPDRRRPRRDVHVLPAGRHDDPGQSTAAQADGTIEDRHDADITPDTIIPPWYGERLDLDHAIYVCPANAANQARQDGSGPPPVQVVGQPDPADRYEPTAPANRVIEPQDWMPSLRRNYTTG